MTNELIEQGTDLTNPMAQVGIGGELRAASTAAAISEIQAAVVLAKQFPRDYETCWEALMSACRRKTLAGMATYAYPRGGKQISGPSVNLARVAAQCFKNFRWGLDVIRDDDEYIQIQGWAWDVENNTKVTADDRFKKLTQRKKDGKTVWVTPDERDLRELVNRRGALLVRNCILHIVPPDFIEDAVGVCKKTKSDSIKDPKGEAKKLILEFQNLLVTVDMLRKFVGHSDSWSADEIVRLGEIRDAIRDGNSKREAFFDMTKTGAVDAADLGDMGAGDAKTHQGYDDKPNGEVDKDTGELFDKNKKDSAK